MTKPKNPRPCSVRGCNKLRRGGAFCEAHYYRFRRYGDTKARPRRKHYDASKTIAGHLTEKFLSGIRKLKGGCWICDTAVSNVRTGYCEVIIERSGGKKVREYAHRLSYRHFKGAIPRGRHILHSCDNRQCCSPEHLSAGTRKQNMQDMVERGRHYRGQHNRLPFLTENDVIAMYALQEQGDVSQYEIGRRFGVNERYIWLILHGRRWRHLYMKHRPRKPVST